MKKKGRIKGKKQGKGGKGGSEKIQKEEKGKQKGRSKRNKRKKATEIRKGRKQCERKGDGGREVCSHCNGPFLRHFFKTTRFD